MVLGALVDSCYLCSMLLWGARPICIKCQQELLKYGLIQREQGGLKICSLLNMSGPAKRLVYRCKNGENNSLLFFLSKILLEKAVLNDFPLTNIRGVVPIPPTAPGVLDHSYWLGRAVSRQWKLPFYPTGLRRKTAGRGPQKSKDVSERTTIEFESDLASLPCSQGVWLLVDDVITTGMTLLQANKALGTDTALCLTLASRPYVLLNVRNSK